MNHVFTQFRRDGQAGKAVERVLKIGSRFGAYRFVEREYRLKAEHDAVFLLFDNGLVFVDGKVERGREQPVFPGLPLLERVAEFPLAGEEIGNQSYRGYEKDKL